jgi:hypothetical protein
LFGKQHEPFKVKLVHNAMESFQQKVPPILLVDQENYLFNLFSKQHGPFEVKPVHNAMESFQQKVPPILLGAFEDIFD